MTSFYTREELLALGFASVGDDVCISRKASFYGAARMHIGNHVRIDDFCLLSGNITVGNYVHISAYVALYGACGITLGDHSGLSPRTTVFSATDDFSGAWLVGPQHAPEVTNVRGEAVSIGRFVQVGAHCVVMPGVCIGEGTAVGAMSWVNRSLPPWGIYIGVPARRLKDRRRDMLRLLPEDEGTGGE